MMVISAAGNRVEGLALSKLMGLSFTGLILIWFIPAPYHYILALLPSFWIGKILIDGAGFLCIRLAILRYMDCPFYKNILEKSAVLNGVGSRMPPFGLYAAGIVQFKQITFRVSEISTAHPPCFDVLWFAKKWHACFFQT